MMVTPDWWLCFTRSDGLLAVLWVHRMMGANLLIGDMLRLEHGVCTLIGDGALPDELNH